LTYRELQEELKISSTSVVAYHLAQLEKRGFLKRNPADPHDYHVLMGEPEKSVAYLNLYGLAYCGPNGTILDDRPVDRIPIPTKFLHFPSVEGFLVKAKGDSMEPKLNEGDIVVARKAGNVESGKVAVCVNNGEAIIKKIQKEGNRTILISVNPIYPPFLAANDFRIVGEVKGVFSLSLD